MQTHFLTICPSIPSVPENLPPILLSAVDYLDKSKQIEIKETPTNKLATLNILITVVTWWQYFEKHTEHNKSERAHTDDVAIIFKKWLLFISIIN